MKDSTASDQNLISDRKSLAILIDGANAQPTLIKEMLGEISKYGQITAELRRLDNPELEWLEGRIEAKDIQPVQRFR